MPWSGERESEEDNILRLVVDSEPRGEKPPHYPEARGSMFPFRCPDCERDFMTGELLLATGDDMPFDDRRYFTAEVRPTARVLIISDHRNNRFTFERARSGRAEKCGSENGFAARDYLHATGVNPAR